MSWTGRNGKHAGILCAHLVQPASSVFTVCVCYGGGWYWGRRQPMSAKYTACLLKIDFLFHGLTVTSHLFISNILDFPTGDVLCSCARFGRKRRKTNPEGEISCASEFRCLYGAGCDVSWQTLAICCFICFINPHRGASFTFSDSRIQASDLRVCAIKHLEPSPSNTGRIGRTRDMWMYGCRRNNDSAPFSRFASQNETPSCCCPSASHPAASFSNGKCLNSSSYTFAAPALMHSSHLGEENLFISSSGAVTTAVLLLGGPHPDAFQQPPSASCKKALPSWTPVFQIPCLHPLQLGWNPAGFHRDRPDVWI